MAAARARLAEQRGSLTPTVVPTSRAASLPADEPPASGATPVIAAAAQLEGHLGRALLRSIPALARALEDRLLRPGVPGAVELAQVVKPGEVEVTINGQPAAAVLGHELQLVEREEGVDASAVLIRAASIAKPGSYTVKATAGGGGASFLRQPGNISTSVGSSGS